MENHRIALLLAGAIMLAAVPAETQRLGVHLGAEVLISPGQGRLALTLEGRATCGGERAASLTVAASRPTFSRSFAWSLLLLSQKALDS